MLVHKATCGLAYIRIEELMKFACIRIEELMKLNIVGVDEVEHSKTKNQKITLESYIQPAQDIHHPIDYLQQLMHKVTYT